MIKNHIFIPVLCLIVGIFVGFGAEKWSADRKMANVKVRLAMLYPTMESSTTMTLLAGTITAINGNTLTISLLSPKDPFDDPLLDERIVMVDDSTTFTIESHRDKDSSMIEKEMAELRDKVKLQNSTAPASVVPPPLPALPNPLLTETKESTFSALQVDQTVHITTVENVKMKKRFVAQNINIFDFVSAMGSAASNAPIPPTPGMFEIPESAAPQPPSQLPSQPQPPPPPAGGAAVVLPPAPGIVQ